LSAVIVAAGAAAAVALVPGHAAADPVKGQVCLIVAPAPQYISMSWEGPSAYNGTLQPVQGFRVDGTIYHDMYARGWAWGHGAQTPGVFGWTRLDHMSC
jgi:hypothetical protein